MGHTVSGGSLYNVTATQVDTDDVVLSGGTMVVDPAGLASATTVSAGGTEIIDAGGTDLGAQLSGGTQFVSGYGSGATISGAGLIVVSAGGSCCLHHRRKQRHHWPRWLRTGRPLRRHRERDDCRQRRPGRRFRRRHRPWRHGQRRWKAVHQLWRHRHFGGAHRRRCRIQLWHGVRVLRRPSL